RACRVDAGGAEGISTASPQPASGKSWPPPSAFRRPATVRARGRKGHHDELQLHPDLPIPDLPSPLPPSLSRWLAGERRSRRHAFRPLLMNSVMLKIRRGDPPFYRRLRDAARRIVPSTLPVPRFLNPLLRFGFNAQLMFMQGL